MQFWQNVQQTAGITGSFHWLILSFVVAAIALFAFLPAERSRVSAAGLLFSLSLIGLFAGATVLFFAPANHPAFVTIQCISRFLQAVAIINLAGMFLFSVLLSTLRLRTPRIM